MKDAVTKLTMRRMVGLIVVVWCVERGLQYKFSRHENLNKSK
jgi:hypothetical protein